MNLFIVIFRDISGKGCLTAPSCGAKYPGYLMKTHPNLAHGERIQTTLCFSKGKTCCAKTQQIEIMKCKDFFVYKLPPACLKRGRYCGNGGKIVSWLCAEVLVFLLLPFVSQRSHVYVIAFTLGTKPDCNEKEILFGKIFKSFKFLRILTT